MGGRKRSARVYGVATRPACGLVRFFKVPSLSVFLVIFSLFPIFFFFSKFSPTCRPRPIRAGACPRGNSRAASGAASGAGGAAQATSWRAPAPTAGASSVDSSGSGGPHTLSWAGTESTACLSWPSTNGSPGLLLLGGLLLYVYYFVSVFYFLKCKVIFLKQSS